MNHSEMITPSQIRARFAAAMSAMYRQEVPLYGELVALVEDINQQRLAQQPEWAQALNQSGSLARLNDERHGAIRLGSAQELSTMRRLFAVMGMFPVSYYDLTIAGIPVHSTAFRPLHIEDLNENPFRIFTSLLRLDLIDDAALKQRAQALLDQRQIFTPVALELIETCERQQGLNAQQAQQFIHAALETFRWHRHATVDAATYRQFLDAHPLIADIVCFRGPHINHLTPRTLDIDAAQQQMQQRGMHPKAIVEGPPQRRHPILLRQTSFQALDEEILFIDANDADHPGLHRARFGEIEQRGMALTPKGRALYDELLQQVRTAQPDAIRHSESYQTQLEKTFQQFPDEATAIRQQGLGYFRYLPGPAAMAGADADLSTLIEQQVLDAVPITYEDFLPVSAAGIFQSNLRPGEASDFAASPNQRQFEQALGCAVQDEFAWYARIQRDSLQHSLQQLGFSAAQQQRLLQALDG